MDRMSLLTKDKVQNFIKDTTRTDKLLGRKNETIYVTNYGYWHASEEFVRVCRMRNLNVEVILL